MNKYYIEKALYFFANTICYTFFTLTLDFASIQCAHNRAELKLFVRKTNKLFHDRPSAMQRVREQHDKAVEFYFFSFSLLWCFIGTDEAFAQFKQCAFLLSLQVCKPSLHSKVIKCLLHRGMAANQLLTSQRRWRWFERAACLLEPIKKFELKCFSINK